MNFFKNRVLSEQQISKTNNNYRLAMELLKKKEYNKALHYFLKAEKELKNQPKIINNIGVCHSNLKQYREAIQYYNKAVQLDSKYFASIYNLSIAYYYLEDYDNALENINLAISVFDRSETGKEKLILAKGNILYKKGNINNAIKYFQTYLERTDSPKVLEKLAEIYLEQNDLDSYKKLFISDDNRVLTNDPEVMKKLVLFSAADQNYDLLDMLLIQYYKTTQDLDWIKEQGRIYYQEEKNKAALLFFERIFNYTPNDNESGMIFAGLLFKSGYLDKAIEVAYQIFQNLLNLKKINDSIKVAEKITKWNPNYLKPRLDLIEYFKKNQNWKLVEKEYETIWTQQKENMKVIKDYMKTLEELSKKDRGYLSKILNVWEEVVSIHPDDPEVLLELGKIYATQLKYQEAIQFFEQALSYKPDLAEAHYQLGLLYLGIKQPNRAYSHLFSIRDKAQTYPEIEEIIKELRSMMNPA